MEPEEEENEYLNSKKLKKLIEKNNICNIQFLEVKLKSEYSGTKLKKFYAANILDLVKGLDFEYTKYNSFEIRGEKHITIIEPVLDYKKIKEYQIFRLKEWPFRVFVSEELKSEIEKKRISGCEFTKVKMR